MFDLERLIKDLGLKKKELAELIGVRATTVSNTINRKALPDHWKILIKESFPDVNFTDYEVDENEVHVSEASTNEQDMRLVPVINKFAYASFIEEWDHPEWLQEQQSIATLCPEDGNYLWFEVKGESMSYEGRNSIEEGDMVLGRELYKKHWSHLQIRRIKLWIIIHRTRGIMLKEITKQDSNGNIECYSWNPIFDDFTINLNDVVQLFYFKELRKSKL